MLLIGIQNKHKYILKIDCVQRISFNYLLCCALKLLEHFLALFFRSIKISQEESKETHVLTIRY